MKAAIYCRISNQDDTRTRSLDTQEEQGISTAKSLGCTEYEVFRERFTGAELYDRPVLSELRDRISQHEFTLVVCHSVDRLSRDPVHLMILVEEFERAKASVHFTTESLDSSPEGKLIGYVKGYAAKLEREKIKERCVRAKKSIIARGSLVGGPSPYGYTFDKQSRMRSINPEQAKIVQKVFELYSGGMTMRQVIQEFYRTGIPSPNGSPTWNQSFICKILRNRAYVGSTYAGQFRIHPETKKCVPVPRDHWIQLGENITPAIISAGLFESVQCQLRTRAKFKYKLSPTESNRRVNLSVYALRGRVKCAVCGRSARPCQSGTQGNKYHYYRCANYRAVGTHKCPGGAVRADILDSVVWKEVSKVLKDPELLAAAIVSMESTKKNCDSLVSTSSELKKRVLGQQAISKRILDRWKIEEDKDVGDALMAEYKQTTSVIKRMKNEIDEIDSRIAMASDDSRKLNTMIDDVRRAVENLENPTQQEMILAFDALGVTARIDGLKNITVEIRNSGETLKTSLKTGQSDFCPSITDSCSCDQGTKKEKAHSHVYSFGPWIVA